MNIENTIKKINALIDGDKVKALDIMQLSQAAVNLANAGAQIKSTELMKGTS